jgi:hypothetical protein
MTAYTREELTRLERERYRRLLDSLRPGQWLDRLGQVRSGHPLNWDELLRLTAPSVDGPECERCGRSAWVPVTRRSRPGLRIAGSRRGAQAAVQGVRCGAGRRPPGG